MSVFTLLYYEPCMETVHIRPSLILTRYLLTAATTSLSCLPLFPFSSPTHINQSVTSVTNSSFLIIVTALRKLHPWILVPFGCLKIVLTSCTNNKKYFYKRYTLHGASHYQPTSLRTVHIMLILAVSAVYKNHADYHTFWSKPIKVKHIEGATKANSLSIATPYKNSSTREYMC